MSSNSNPIGIFDSGVGGLTVFRELKELLPNEDYVYLGDTARVPYGTKSKDIVVKYALQDSLFLMDKGVKLIVVACNTASAFALKFLQDRLKVPVIGVIEPGAQAAISVTKNNRIGIVGTEGTISSQVYESALKNFSKEVFCIAKSTGLFVPLVEEAITKSEILYPVFDYYLKDFVSHKIDTLVLGCTHYPLLKQALSEYFDGQIQLVDSALATAAIVKSIIDEKQLTHPKQTSSTHQIFVTDAPERVQRIASQFLGQKDVSIQKVDLN